MNTQLFQRIEASPANVEFLVTVSYLEVGHHTYEHAAAYRLDDVARDSSHTGYTL